MSIRAQATGRAVETCLRSRRRWLDQRGNFAKSAGFRRNVVLTYRADDAHSHVVAQLLQRIVHVYQLDVKVRVVNKPELDVRPEPYLYARHAVSDASMNAVRFSVRFPNFPNLPSDAFVGLAHAGLTAVSNEPHVLASAIRVGEAVWRNDLSALKKLSSEMQQRGAGQRSVSDVLSSNSRWMRCHGFYESGAVYYRGEWYHGVDRLWHLIERLRREERAPHDSLNDFIKRNAWSDFSSEIRRKGGVDEKIEMFFSFRSPFSYIGIERLFNHCEFPSMADKLRLRPVLPIVQRGLRVPTIKKKYIVHDAKREADRYGVLFGRMYDPLGHGIPNCMAGFFGAQERGLALPYVRSVLKGIWSEAADVSDDRTLFALTERAGLAFDRKLFEAWPEARWKAKVAANAREHADTSLWGVPVFRRGSLQIWGQDRVPMLFRG